MGFHIRLREMAGDFTLLMGLLPLLKLWLLCRAGERDDFHSALSSTILAFSKVGSSLVAVEAFILGE